MNVEGPGIYFNPETMEILRVTDSDPSPSAGWIRISEDYTQGLLAVRSKVKEQGLVDDPTPVQWRGMGSDRTDVDGATSQLIRRFKWESEEYQEKARNRSGFLGRLAARLKSVVRGSSSGPDGPPSVGPAGIHVRSRDAEGPRKPSGR